MPQQKPIDVTIGRNYISHFNIPTLEKLIKTQIGDLWKDLSVLLRLQGNLDFF